MMNRQKRERDERRVQSNGGMAPNKLWQQKGPKKNAEKMIARKRKNHTENRKWYSHNFFFFFPI